MTGSSPIIKCKVNSSVMKEGIHSALS